MENRAVGHQSGVDLYSMAWPWRENLTSRTRMFRHISQLIKQKTKRKKKDKKGTKTSKTTVQTCTILSCKTSAIYVDLPFMFMTDDL